MLRTNIYYHPFCSTVHQNVKKPMSTAVKTICGNHFDLCMGLISGFFFPLSRCEHASIKLQNRVAIRQKKTHISTISTTEWRAKIVDQKNYFYYFARSYTCSNLGRDLNTIELTSSAVRVLCGFID